MFFEKDDMVFQILDVLYFDEDNTDTFNAGRNFCALSFRSFSNSDIIVHNNTYHMGNNSVCFVPNAVDYKRIAVRDRMIVIHLNLLNHPYHDIECFTAQDTEQFRTLFEEILALWQKKEAGYKYACSALVYRILEQCHKEVAQNKIEHPIIQKSIDYMLEHYKNPHISITEIAHQSHVSEVYFRQLFRKCFHVSPIQYLIRLRIQHAVGLINTGCYSLKEVAAASGYEDYNYFSTAFKKHTGVSPSKYFYSFQGAKKSTVL